MGVAVPAARQTESHARSAEADGRNSLRPSGYPAGRQRGGCQNRHLEPRMVPRRQTEFLAGRTLGSYERCEGRA